MTSVKDPTARERERDGESKVVMQKESARAHVCCWESMYIWRELGAHVG